MACCAPLCACGTVADNTEDVPPQRLPQHFVFSPIDTSQSLHAERSEPDGKLVFSQTLRDGQVHNGTLSRTTEGGVAPPPRFDAAWSSRLSDGGTMWFRLEGADTLSTRYEKDDT
eukprot:gene18991-31854_t